MDEIEEAKDLVNKWEADINEHRKKSNRNQGLAAVFMIDAAEKKLNSILKSLKGKDSIYIFFVFLYISSAPLNVLHPTSSSLLLRQYHRCRLSSLVSAIRAET